MKERVTRAKRTMKSQRMKLKLDDNEPGMFI